MWNTRQKAWHGVPVPHPRFGLPSMMRSAGNADGHGHFADGHGWIWAICTRWGDFGSCIFFSSHMYALIQLLSTSLLLGLRRSVSWLRCWLWLLWSLWKAPKSQLILELLWQSCEFRYFQAIWLQHGRTGTFRHFLWRELSKFPGLLGNCAQAVATCRGLGSVNSLQHPRLGMPWPSLQSLFWIEMWWTVTECDVTLRKRQGAAAATAIYATRWQFL